MSTLYLVCQFIYENQYVRLIITRITYWFNTNWNKAFSIYLYWL